MSLSTSVESAFLVTSGWNTNKNLEEIDEKNLHYSNVISLRLLKSVTNLPFTLRLVIPQDIEKTILIFFKMNEILKVFWLFFISK